MSSCVIIIENLPAPADRRVWQEACALRDSGWKVSIICPRTVKYPKAEEVIEEIHIFRHPLPLEASGKLGFLLEYGSALFFELIYLTKVLRKRGFDVIQACNPPDLIFIPVLPFKLMGKRFVFDHHDVCPELFAVKFNGKGWLHKGLLLAERATFRLADLVISANETYRQIAISRGGKKPEDVVAVYSVPDTRRIHRVAPDPALRKGVRVVIGYIGVIADQDGVDHMVRCIAHLVQHHGVKDIGGLVIGDGPSLDKVKTLAAELGIADHITFTGFLSGDALLSALSSIDIGMIPDPPNPYNDKVSMNKVFEYSVLGIPPVSYDLQETRRLLGDAGSYAPSNDPEGLAAACLPLINDPDKLHTAAGAAAELARRKFNWDNEAKAYTQAFSRFLPTGAAQTIRG